MGLRVLVVDDAAFVRDTIKRTLRRMIPDVELFEAVDGRRATAVIKINSVDIILSDWEMPEMSGEEFLIWVRAHPMHANTPFIMVTSRGDRNHVLQAAQTGVSDYLTKPFTAEELERKIQKQLKRIGYAPKTSKAMNQASGFGSIEALTGGDPERRLPKQAVASKSTLNKGLPLPNTSASKKKVSAPAVSSGFKGKAWLRFPQHAYDCSVREISLQGMSGTLLRPEVLPTVFDQAVVDLEDENGEALASMNVYVHNIAAVEPSPEATTVRIGVRFVDDDPHKMDILSRIIAG
jgi:DNA-binding response OmpR family regulator